MLVGFLLGSGTLGEEEGLCWLLNCVWGTVGHTKHKVRRENSR